MFCYLSLYIGSGKSITPLKIVSLAIFKVLESKKNV